MKKFLACLLALVMALSLMACGDTTTDDTGDTGDDTQLEDNTGDTTDTTTEGDSMGDSIMEILKDRFVAAPELAGTSWVFIGGYVQGKQLTEEQTAEVLSQMGDIYQFDFMDESTVVLSEGADTTTDGTYSISEDGLIANLIMSNDFKYAGTFIEQEDGPVMVALLDGTGMNALYFHLYMGE